MRMLVALDGPERAREVAHYAGQIAADAGKDMEITLYHVVEVPSALAEHGGSENPATETRIEERLAREEEQWLDERRSEVEQTIFAPAIDQIRQSAGKRAVSIHAETSPDTQRDVARDIVEKVRHDGYDLLVLGRRRQSKVKEALLGSVSSKVVDALEGHDVRIAA